MQTGADRVCWGGCFWFFAWLTSQSTSSWLESVLWDGSRLNRTQVISLVPVWLLWILDMWGRLPGSARCWRYLQQRNLLQRTVRTAERIIGVHLPSLQDLFYSRVKKRAGNIITDPSHPGHDLFALLPSGRRYRSLCTRTSRHKNSFFPHAISSLNN